MFIRVEHIGIAVKDLDAGEALYSRLLGKEPYKRELVESEKVLTSFFDADTKIELLYSTSDEGVIARYIEKKGEGLHHIAFEVDDIFKEMDRLKKEGFTLLNDHPKEGADNKLVCFVHPKTSGGVLIELCMDKSKIVSDKLVPA